MSAKLDKPKNGGILDKNGRLFGRINIIDMLVVILALGLAGTILYRFTSSAMAKDTDTRVRYTILIEGVREFTLDYYKIGLTCFDNTKQEYIGDIADIRYEPLTAPVTQLDGSLLVVEQPERLRVYVDIEANARETDSAFLLNGAYELKVGSQINLNTRYIDVWGLIISAKIVEG